MVAFRPIQRRGGALGPRYITCAKKEDDGGEEGVPTAART